MLPTPASGRCDSSWVFTARRLARSDRQNASAVSAAVEGVGPLDRQRARVDAAHRHRQAAEPAHVPELERLRRRRRRAPTTPARRRRRRVAPAGADPQRPGHRRGGPPARGPSSQPDQQVLAPAARPRDTLGAGRVERGRELRVRRTPTPRRTGGPTTSGSSWRRMRLDLGQLRHPSTLGQASMTTGTIIGRRRVRSLTNRPAARRTSRCSVSMSAAARRRTPP